MKHFITNWQSFKWGYNLHFTYRPYKIIQNFSFNLFYPFYGTSIQFCQKCSSDCVEYVSKLECNHWYTMISHPEIVGLPRIEGFCRIRLSSHLKSRSWCAAKYQCNVARQFTSTKTWNKLSLESVSLLSDIEYYWKDRQIQLYWGSMSQLRLISVPSSC